MCLLIVATLANKLEQHKITQGLRNAPAMTDEQLQAGYHW